MEDSLFGAGYIYGGPLIWGRLYPWRRGGYIQGGEEVISRDRPASREAFASKNACGLGFGEKY